MFSNKKIFFSLNRAFFCMAFNYSVDKSDMEEGMTLGKGFSFFIRIE